MEKTKSLLDEVLKKYGILNKIRGFYPVIKWNEIVGNELTKYTKPVKIRRWRAFHRSKFSSL